jgi:hypothetical protein
MITGGNMEKDYVKGSLTATIRWQGCKHAEVNRKAGRVQLDVSPSANASKPFFGSSPIMPVEIHFIFVDFHDCARVLAHYLVSAAVHHA